jgi:hypothetical protein
MVPTTEYRSRMPERLRRLLPWVALVVVAIGFLNFVWFFSESSTIGDAQRGYILDGRYYLVHAGVGTEVSRATWDWSNLHAASLFVTHPLAMAAGAFLLFTVVFPSMTRNGDATVTALRVQRIRASGSATASQRTGGKVGELRATKPLVTVNVHPGGVVIKVIGLAPVGIEAANLTSVVSSRSKFGTATVRILHREIGAPPDILLYLDASSPVTTAIRGLMPLETGSGADRAPRVADDPPVEPYPTVMKAMIIVGFGLSLVFALVAWPFAGRLGGFGLIWSLGLVLILGYNAWKYFIRDRHRW